MSQALWFCVGRYSSELLSLPGQSPASATPLQSVAVKRYDRPRLAPVID